MSVSIRAGDLRHPVAIQEFVEIGRTDANEPIGEWRTVVRMFAKVEPLSGKEYLANRAIQAEVRVKVTIRYRRGVGPLNRLLHCGKEYNIEAAINLESANVALELHCVERTA